MKAPKWDATVEDWFRYYRQKGNVPFLLDHFKAKMPHSTPETKRCLERRIEALKMVQLIKG